MTDLTHLVVASTTNMMAGDMITQGTHFTTITSVDSPTGLTVADTTGWIAGAAVDNNVLVVGSTTGWVVGEALDSSINISFNYLITAVGATSYGISPIPAGLSIDSLSGLVSGIPTVPVGNYNITISATNSSGTSTIPLTLTIS